MSEDKNKHSLTACEGIVEFRHTLLIIYNGIPSSLRYVIYIKFNDSTMYVLSSQGNMVDDSDVVFSKIRNMAAFESRSLPYVAP